MSEFNIPMGMKLVPDNVYNKPLDEVRICTGWEKVPKDWYRIPILGDFWVESDNSITCGSDKVPRIIVRQLRMPKDWTISCKDIYGENLPKPPQNWDYERDISNAPSFRPPKEREYFLNINRSVGYMTSSDYNQSNYDPRLILKVP
jgi:hypothetical protein